MRLQPQAEHGFQDDEIDRMTVIGASSDAKGPHRAPQLHVLTPGGISAAASILSLDLALRLTGP